MPNPFYYASFCLESYPSYFLVHVPSSILQHAANLLLVHKLLEAGVEVGPPLKQHGVADELEPRGELQARVVELLLELFGRNVLGSLDLVGAGVEVNVGLDEEDVVDCVISMLAQLAIMQYKVPIDACV